MKTPVVAIGLDAGDPDLIEEWMAEGKLPVLAGLREQGAYGRLHNLDHYKAETPWTTFLTGRMPEDTGYWSPVRFVEGTYRMKEIGAYDYQDVPPFYALGHDYRVAVFDVPQTRLSPEVNGPQVLAWGAHSPQTDSMSSPPELLAELTARFGEHPALHRDDGDWWDRAYLRRLHRALLTGIERRVAICRDFLAQERWNLFLTVFGETHSAGHDLWHLSRPDHPLYGKLRDLFETDPLLDVFQATDRAIGQILEGAPADGYRLVFSVHGSDNNVTDAASMALLPEFLYRYSFPGRVALAPGDSAKPIGGVMQPVRNQHWQHELKTYRYDASQPRRLIKSVLPRRLHGRLEQVVAGEVSPDLYTIKELKDSGAAVAWQPTQWYSKSWHKMKAFALPTFSEGYIRINLKGREPAGTVEAADYQAVCDDLVENLMQLVNPRTGERAIKKIVRTRSTGGDNRDPNLPDADLVIVWSETPADVVDHPRFGRIGPIPFRRTGSHRERGFWMLQGRGIQAGGEFPESHAVRLPATILELMGAPRANQPSSPILTLQPDPVGA